MLQVDPPIPTQKEMCACQQPIGSLRQATKAEIDLVLGAFPVYDFVMLHVSRTMRSLIVAGLILSLGVVGGSPALMATASGEAAFAADNASAHTCCCGTKDGRCCGMACCGTQAPKQQRTPAPQKDRGELDGSLLIACWKAAPETVTVGSNDSHGWDVESAVAGVRSNTLQSLQMLLQT